MSTAVSKYVSYPDAASHSGSVTTSGLRMFGESSPSQLWGSLVNTAPWLWGYSPVSSEGTDGYVQGAVDIAFGNLNP